jgi:hypothetical protein
MLQKFSTMSLLTQQLAEQKAALADPDHPVALRFLDEQLARGGLDINGYNKLREVLSMISEISLLLFPRPRCDSDAQGEVSFQAHR